MELLVVNSVILRYCTFSNRYNIFGKNTTRCCLFVTIESHSYGLFFVLAQIRVPRLSSESLAGSEVTEVDDLASARGRC